MNRFGRVKDEIFLGKFRGVSTASGNLWGIGGLVWLILIEYEVGNYPEFYVLRVFELERGNREKVGRFELRLKIYGNVHVI